MTDPYNAPYRRRFPNPWDWPSNNTFGRYAEEATRRRVNELSWEIAGADLADEVASYLQLREPLPGREPRAGDPGE